MIFFVFYNDTMLVNTLKLSLQSRFKIKDSGQVANMLGIKVDNSVSFIKLSQERTFELLLGHYGMFVSLYERPWCLTLQKEYKKALMYFRTRN